MPSWAELATIQFLGPGRGCIIGCKTKAVKFYIQPNVGNQNYS